MQIRNVENLKKIKKYLTFKFERVTIISLEVSKNQKKPYKILLFYVFFYSYMLDFL